MDVFSVFQSTVFTFLELNEGGILGNTVKSQSTSTGIFKERNGMAQNNNMETVQSDATMHIRPSDSYLASVAYNVVGHGIRATKNGSTQDYRIIGQVEGFDFDTNTLEFYRLTLKAESLAEYTNDSSS